MSLIADVLGTVIEGLIELIVPSSPRGTVARTLIIGILLLAATAWLLVFHPDRANQPSWSFGAIVCAVVLSPMGIIVGGLHWQRNEGQPADRLLAISSILTNAAAAGLAVIIALLTLE